mgnify:CR=1 FL=1
MEHQLEKFVYYHQLKNYGVIYCRSHIWRLEKKNLFPKRISLSPSRICWLETEILEWMTKQIARRDEAIAEAQGEL